MHTCTVSMLSTAQLVDVHIEQKTLPTFSWTVLYIMLKDYHKETLSQDLGNSGLKRYCMVMMILTMNLMLQSYWLCMSLLKTLKDSDCTYYMFIIHNCFVLTIPSMWNLLCMRVSTTWQLWLLNVFTCLRMYGVILVTLVWVCCVNVSMIDSLC